MSPAAASNYRSLEQLAGTKQFMKAGTVETLKEDEMHKVAEDLSMRHGM